MTSHPESKIPKLSVDRNETKPEENKQKDQLRDKFQFSELTLEELRQLSMNFIKERNWDQFHSPRNVLLALVGEVGELAEIFQWKGEVSEGLPELSDGEKEHVGQELSDVLLYLIDLSQRCRTDLSRAVKCKMVANAKKYPADKAYGRAGKYTDYQQNIENNTSNESKGQAMEEKRLDDIPNENQGTNKSDIDFHFSALSLEDLRIMFKNFVEERNWAQFHSPRNVLLDLVAEVGELAEIFQWKGEVTEGLPELSEDEQKHVAEELSDVLTCLVSLSQRCRIDLSQAVKDKMASNARKYPIDKAFGRANKYTDYQ